MIAVRIARSGGGYRVLGEHEATHEDTFTVDVEDTMLTRWRAAERAYADAQAEMGALFDAAEDAYYAALPEPDPDAPPPGPIRALFPHVGVAAQIRDYWMTGPGAERPPPGTFDADHPPQNPSERNS